MPGRAPICRRRPDPIRFPLEIWLGYPEYLRASREAY